MTTYRFPIPRAERILLLVGAILGALPPLVVLYVLAQIGAGAGLAVGDMFAQSTQLRAAYAAMWAAWALGLVALLVFHRVKEGARLVVEADAVRFTRPGAPLTGWWAADVTVPAARADRIILRDVLRGTVKRIELELGAGHDQIRVNLGHATSDGNHTPLRPADKATWTSHPLVVDVAKTLGRDPEVL